MDALLTRPFLFRLGEPGPAEMRAYADLHGKAELTYADIGSTRTDLPLGWDHDEVKGEIGRGADAALRAEAGLRRWAMFDLDWIRPVSHETPLVEGEIVAYTARIFGLWVINVCRIVYVIEEDDGVVRRVGFAYGTLPTHGLAGEEQFLLEWDRRTDVVTFGLRKFSRFDDPLVRLGGWFTRRFQRRFNRDVIARMAEVARGAGDT